MPLEAIRTSSGGYDSTNNSRFSNINEAQTPSKFLERVNEKMDEPGLYQNLKSDGLTPKKPALEYAAPRLLNVGLYANDPEDDFVQS